MPLIVMVLVYFKIYLAARNRARRSLQKPPCTSASALSVPRPAGAGGGDHIRSTMSTSTTVTSLGNNASRTLTTTRSVGDVDRLSPSREISSDVTESPQSHGALESCYPPEEDDVTAAAVEAAVTVTADGALSIFTTATVAAVAAAAGTPEHLIVVECSSFPTSNEVSPVIDNHDLHNHQNSQHEQERNRHHHDHHNHQQQQQQYAMTNDYNYSNCINTDDKPPSPFKNETTRKEKLFGNEKPRKQTSASSASAAGPAKKVRYAVCKKLKGGGGGKAATSRQLGPEVVDPERMKRRLARARERRATLVLGIVMASFVGCWLPFFTIYPITLFIGGTSSISYSYVSKACSLNCLTTAYNNSASVRREITHLFIYFYQTYDIHTIKKYPI